MIVNATWVDDEMIRIEVVDTTAGAVSSLDVCLSDFVTSADAQNSQYIKIQAVDMDANLSGIVQIKNPFYNPTLPVVIAEEEYGDDSTTDISAIPSPSGLTPDGLGTVVDNIITQNEIEFFTVYTEEGNVFFLVVDRNSNSDNVYLLNAVTEADLMTLAEQSGNPISDVSGNDVSAVPTPPNFEPPVGGVDTDGQGADQPSPNGDADLGGTYTPQRDGNNNLAFIGIIVVSVAGLAYYFKIMKPKRSNTADDNDLWGDEADDWDSENDYLSNEDLHEDIDKGGEDE